MGAETPGIRLVGRRQVGLKSRGCFSYALEVREQERVARGHKPIQINAQKTCRGRLPRAARRFQIRGRGWGRGRAADVRVKGSDEKPGKKSGASPLTPGSAAPHARGPQK